MDHKMKRKMKCIRCGGSKFIRLKDDLKEKSLIETFRHRGDSAFKYNRPERKDPKLERRSFVKISIPEYKPHYRECIYCSKIIKTMPLMKRFKDVEIRRNLGNIRFYSEEYRKYGS